MTAVKQHHAYALLLKGRAKLFIVMVRIELNAVDSGQLFTLC
jgi:hypothetical protein